MNKFIISLVISSLMACSVNAQETDLKTTLMLKKQTSKQHSKQHMRTIH